MRLLFAIILTVGGLSSAAVSAKSGYSQEYNQCLNTSYGQSKTIIQCVDKELKLQKKLLKKYYKTNLKNSPNYQANFEQQHRLWQNQMNQQCHFNIISTVMEIKQKKCVLEMTKQRAGDYEMKQIGYK